MCVDQRLGHSIPLEVRAWEATSKWDRSNQWNLRSPAPGHTSHPGLPFPLSYLPKDFSRADHGRQCSLDLDCKLDINKYLQSPNSHPCQDTLLLAAEKKKNHRDRSHLIPLHPYFSPFSLVQAIKISCLNKSPNSCLLVSHYDNLNTPMASQCL